MEQHLGRKLTVNEVVHHLDDDRLNNDISNLKVMYRGCHGQMHFSISKWSLNYDACTSCGTVEIEHEANGLCKKCYRRNSYAIKGY
jgi:hypothetical protein